MAVITTQSAAPSSATARLVWVSDAEPYDSSYIDTWEIPEEEKEQAREELHALAESDGVWGRCSEILCPTCGTWDTAGGVWGIVGPCEDILDHDFDMKAEADEEAKRRGMPPLVWESQ